MVTGHGGFVGHHCVRRFLGEADWDVVGLDSFRHRGTVRRVVEGYGGVETYVHDLRVPIDRQLACLLGDVEIVVNFASESAVERSAADPSGFIRNNCELMLTVLEYARSLPNLKALVHISTDEVYGEAAGGVGHAEWSPIVPSSPYAASKAAQEAFAVSYWRTYGLPVVILNVMNLIGERQDVEKFLPKVVSLVSRGETVPIYSCGGVPGSRCYLHAEEVASAVLFVLGLGVGRYDEGVPGCLPDRYNVCGGEEVTNLRLAEMAAGAMGRELRYELVPSGSARPGHDRRYLLDGSKLASLGWRPSLDTEAVVRRVVEWTMANPHWTV